MKNVSMLLYFLIPLLLFADTGASLPDQNYFVDITQVNRILGKIQEINAIEKENYTNQIIQNAIYDPELNYYYLNFLSNYYGDSLQQINAIKYLDTYRCLSLKRMIARNKWIDAQKDDLINEFNGELYIQRQVNKYLSSKIIPVQGAVNDSCNNLENDLNKINYFLTSLMTNADTSQYDSLLNYTDIRKRKEKEIQQIISKFYSNTESISKERSKNNLDITLDNWFILKSENEPGFSHLYQKHLEEYYTLDQYLVDNSIFKGTSKYSLKLGVYFDNIKHKINGNIDIDTVDFTVTYGDEVMPLYFGIEINYCLFKKKWIGPLAMANTYLKAYISPIKKTKSYNRTLDDYYTRYFTVENDLFGSTTYEKIFHRTLNFHDLNSEYKMLYLL